MRAFGRAAVCENPNPKLHLPADVSDEFEALAFLELDIMPAKMSFLSVTPAPPRGSQISLGQHSRQEHDKEKHNSYQDHRL